MISSRLDTLYIGHPFGLSASSHVNDWEATASGAGESYCHFYFQVGCSGIVLEKQMIFVSFYGMAHGFQSLDKWAGRYPWICRDFKAYINAPVTIDESIWFSKYGLPSAKLWVRRLSKSDRMGLVVTSSPICFHRRHCPVKPDVVVFPRRLKTDMGYFTACVAWCRFLKPVGYSNAT